MLAYINNKLVRLEDSRVSVFDHGLMYGDGVYETMRTYNKRIFKLKEHLNRLSVSAQMINLRIPYTSAEIESAIYKTLNANHFEESMIKLIITRGEGHPGMTADCKVNLIIIVTEAKPKAEALYTKGVTAITTRMERFLPKAKTLNCLPNILAKQKADEAGAYEAIMINSVHLITEGTLSNLFMVYGKRIITPNENILYGVTRDAVLELAKRHYEVEERMFDKEELLNADEVFLTNTSSGVIPVVKIDDKFIGKSEPGNVTKHLMNELNEYAKHQVR